MHSKSDRIDVMNHDKEDEVIEERFQSLPSGEEIGLETSIKVYVFFFFWLYSYIVLQISWNKSELLWIICTFSSLDKKATNTVKDGHKCF